MNDATPRLVGCPTIATLPPPPRGRRGWPWTVEPSPLPATQADGAPWPRVSIVTPSYNQGAFIEETIRSVLLQGYPNLEYAVVDGGSTDESVAIIQRYEPWLARWVSAKDDGQSDAINKGMASATGDILGWLNSDDYFAPGALGLAAIAFASGGSGIGAVVGTGSKVDRQGRVVYSPLPSEVTRDTLLDWCDGMNFMQPACLFSRAAWAHAGPLRLDLDYCMDLALWLGISERFAFRVITDTLAFVHIHEDAKTIRARHRMFAEIALLLATDAGVPEKAKTLLFSVLDADDTQKRGVKHLSQALGREIMRRLRASLTPGP